MDDVTMQEWEEMQAEVRTEVERAAKDDDSPILRTVLDVLDQPNDFIGEVVERMLA